MDDSFRMLWSGQSRRVASVVAAAGVAVLSGCQSYEKKPLDVAGHQAAFLARLPENAEVRGLAERMAEGMGKQDAAERFDLANGVSGAEAEVIALVFNAELRVARLRAGVTRATAEHAGLWADPTIGVDVTRIVQSTPEPWKVFSSVGLTIPISGRLEVEKRRAGVEHAAELARAARQEWLVRMAVRRTWSEWAALEAQVRETREFVGRVDQILTVVDKMERAGEIARTEARLFRIERASKAAELAVLEARMREAELRLRQLMGIAPDAALVWQGGVGGLPRGVEVTGTRAEWESTSPAMLVATAEYEATERSLELEIRKQYPDLHIGPGVGREDGQDQVLLGVSLPLPLWNANRQGIAEARAQREVARAHVEGTLEQVIAARRVAEVQLEAATQRRMAFESEIVPLVDAQYADAREMGRLGEVNTLVLLESLTRQQEAKVGLIAAIRDEAMATIDLEELRGPLGGLNGEKASTK